MENFEQLTTLQKGLVSGLISEFTKINPKSANGTSRFSFDTINDCMKEEQRFKDTMSKHNMTMMKVFVQQLKSDIKEFKKEFGKVLDIELGYMYDNKGKKFHCLETMIEEITKNPLHFSNYSSEIKLFIVSKTKEYTGDSRYNYFNNKAYHCIYVNPKFVRVDVTLESGKKVDARKIVGLNYKWYDWLNDDKDYSVKYSTLDEMVQSDKNIQQKIVYLVQ